MGTDDLGNVIVEVILSPTPPKGWASLWTPYPPNSSRSTAYGPPHMHGNKVTFHVPENKVKSAVEMLDGQIAAANDYYEKEPSRVYRPPKTSGIARRKNDNESSTPLSASLTNWTTDLPGSTSPDAKAYGTPRTSCRRSRPARWRSAGRS